MVQFWRLTLYILRHFDGIKNWCRTFEKPLQFAAYCNAVNFWSASVILLDQGKAMQ